VVWDLHEHRAIDHGYATTSYRSQGRTVDSVFALASAAEARRGLYVDVTRAREDVTIAYGKDEVQDFGDLLVRAQRDSGKCSCVTWSATSVFVLNESNSVNASRSDYAASPSSTSTSRSSIEDATEAEVGE
jgi:ATP-dependent exoDNAse (exonuclease V) beta subunit